jgi:hypothetical protein
MNKTSDESANRDPITGAPGAHPLATGLGAAAGGAATGAAVGTVAGPVGTLVGAAVGVVVGGLAGKAIGEAIDPTREDAYWRENYSTRPYVDQGASYSDYGPAYGFGVDAVTRYPGRKFEDLEPELSSKWTGANGTSSLRWERARDAARDAFDRVNRAH